MKILVLGLVISLSATAWGAQGSQNAEAFQLTKQHTSEMLGESTSMGGRVVEKIDVSTYTYVQFSHGKETFWLATSKTDVRKGDLVSFANAQTMHNFHSKALNRTFEQIYFVTDLTVKR